MLKLVFWLLFVINIAVFATAPESPALPKTSPVSPNPVPVEPERIRLLSASAPATPNPEPQNRLSGTTCIEIGNFNPQDADIFEKKMALPPDMASRTNIDTASSYMVYIPPQKNAARKIEELQEKGISTYFLIQEGKFRHAISLGIFKTEDSARKLVSELEKRNIRDTVIAGRGKIIRHIVFRITNPDALQLEHMDKLLAAYPKVTRKDCPKPDENSRQGNDAI